VCVVYAGLGTTSGGMSVKRWGYRRQSIGECGGTQVTMLFRHGVLCYGESERGCVQQNLEGVVEFGPWSRLRRVLPPCVVPGVRTTSPCGSEFAREKQQSAEKFDITPGRYLSLRVVTPVSAD